MNKQNLKRINSYLLLKTILSALLFSLSFFFIDQIGFAIIFPFILNFLIINHCKSIKNSVLYGFFWGFIGLGLHFIWLYELLLNESGATFLLAFQLYFFIVFYSALLTSIYFLITKFFFNLFKKIYLKFSIYFITTFMFFYFIDTNFLLLIGIPEGYPFLNPFIPLARYKFFIFLLNLFSLNSEKPNINNEKFLENNKIIYLQPFKNIEVRENSLALLIYQQLAELELYKIQNEYKNIILLSPETYYPFALNENPQSVKLWNNALPDNTMFFVGSQKRAISGKFLQSVYLLNKGRIIDSYDKKHSVIFAEHIPSIYKKLKWSKNLFLNGKKEFLPASKNNNFFKIDQDINILPQICSEFFYRKFLKFGFNQTDYIFIFINDSWFMPYFVKIMKNLTKIIHNLYFKKSILFYIGHSELLIN